MLRKRGGGLSKGRKMAKKNTPAALQTEVSTDEEWAKILERKGLIVADIYSEWSGPCSGMISILKKIKMEIGGDLLSYVTAKCDNIAALERFRGKSEPTWMFIHNGQMVNLMFGAYCPELQKMLTDELRRVQNGEEHEFCIPVSQRSPEEENRMKILEEERTVKEAAKKAEKEAEIKAKYEAEMLHYTNSLQDETLLILYPWVFKDAEGHKRDKISSPPYADLIENILPGNYAISQELRKKLDEETLSKMFFESDWDINENAKNLLMDGRCMCMRLRVSEKKPEMDVEKYLLSLLFGEPRLPLIDEKLPEGCFAERHRPAFLPSDKEGTEYPVVWAAPNPRNKATVFRLIFRKYVETTFPYEDKTVKAPIIVFKYDSTRRNELKMVLDIYESEVVNFGIFERDKPPEAKLIATSIEEFDENFEGKTGKFEQKTWQIRGFRQCRQKNWFRGFSDFRRYRTLSR
ncbi:thioredoxin domain-containing protein 3-like isoform X2 [Venturia canescens]|uniref:thioredoxin domain-containing protein 3-like isoform X2 n=1 Tax=Venturia canescens TaxID=32260 RepID=UPI001C9CC164|nr:thioredoxin domain-containing protein 3-like isoform X2 [Venturia canescens]